MAKNPIYLYENINDQNLDIIDQLKINKISNDPRQISLNIRERATYTPH